MSYTKQTWVDNDPNSPLSGARLTHIEDGIYAAHGLAVPLAYAQKTSVNADDSIALTNAFADVDAALAVTFTAPASGKVKVEFHAYCDDVADYALYDVDATAIVAKVKAGTDNQSPVVLLTTLTPDQEYTLKWQAKYTASSADIHTGTDVGYPTMIVTAL